MLLRQRTGYYLFTLRAGVSRAPANCVHSLKMAASKPTAIPSAGGGNRTHNQSLLVPGPSVPSTLGIKITLPAISKMLLALRIQHHHTLP